MKAKIMKKRSKFVNYIIYVYVIAFVLYSFLGRILPISLFVGDKINSLIYIVFAVIGGGLILADFFYTKKVVMTKNFFVLILFVAAMVLSSIINCDMGYIDNIKTIIWTIIQITIFYSMYLRIDEKYISLVLKYFFVIISILWTIAVTISLIQFVIQDAYMYDITGVGYRYQGFYENRLFGIFNDPNFAAITSGYVLLMLSYVFLKMNKKWYKIALLSISFVFNLLYVLLSGSRTAYVGVSSAFFIFIFLILKNYFVRKKHSLILSFLCAAFFIGMIIEIIIPIKNIIVCIPETYMTNYASKVGHGVQDKILMKLLREREDVILYWQKSPLEINDEQTLEDNGESIEVNQNNDKVNYESSELQKDVASMLEESVEKSNDEKNILKREDITSNNISNNRIEIWKEYLSGMKGRYLFGTSPRNMLCYFEKMETASYVVERKYEIHNGYLAVFVGCGIVGSIPVIIFIYLVAKKILNYCFKKQNIELEFIVTFSIICLILIYTMFFTELFFVNNLTTSIFWSLLGFLWIWLDKDDIEKKEGKLYGKLLEGRIKENARTQS